MEQRNQLPIFEKPVDDYLRVMTATPVVAIADPMTNAARIIETYEEARQVEAELLVLPELNLTAYSAADLFHNDHVLEQTQKVLPMLAEETLDGPAMIVGAPLRSKGILYNCAVMLAEGEIKGVVPKTHLPNYNEFYEMRWFTSGKNITRQEIAIGDQIVPFGTDLLFNVNNATVGVEICEDLWGPTQPSTESALQGADIIVNLSASNEIIGKAAKRRELVGTQAGRLACGYVYVSAGDGESNADVVYGGHHLINEAGRTVAERKPFAKQTSMLFDFDLKSIQHDRVVNKTFASVAVDTQTANPAYRSVKITAPQPHNDLYREVNPYPFVPNSEEKRNERCQKIIQILAEGYASRLKEIDAKATVIGLSGGLDSTLGLIIALEAARLLGKNNTFIHTITMPGPASSERTQSNATLLATALGTTHSVRPIDTLTTKLLDTIDHDQVTEDVTYENTQARMRTNLLMNYANKVGGIVQGTGDLSEILQGWCTYNGDHMSMFNPNGDVPKTLIRYLVQWYADFRADTQTKTLLCDILDTPVSPELTGNGDLSQATESIIGPYDLHDFYTDQLQRHGTRPEKVGYLATQAFAGKYTEETIEKWLFSYLNKFTGSQWKREAMPGSTMFAPIAPSPRTTLRMAPNTSPNWYK